MERDYLDYLQDILNSINEIESFIKGIADFSVFEMDRKTVNAVIRSLEVIGEAVKKIPDDIKNQYSEIPWKNMAGIRDKLIHEYFGVDEEIVWKVASEELPPFKLLFQNILKEKQ
ncbi:DUF86 domain-containing protein [Candidatus Wolfebacteria bacterium]|nr:DUF86 domain-containing protein [Candidatus Wolfebacteria bacterium]